MHPGDLAGGFSDLEITWLFCCAGAATVYSGRLEENTMVGSFTYSGVRSMVWG